MPNDVQKHYDALLAEHYTWMFGQSFEAKVLEQRDLLLSMGLERRAHGLALDLGAGPGFQALALTELGFSPVVAVDTSKILLAELKQHVGNRNVNVQLADIRDLPSFAASGSVSAIVCMGDTLTHLRTVQEVRQLFSDAYTRLAPEGQLALTFRDFSAPLYGVDRFLPIRADQDRIMTCVLDYEPEHVVVTDLVHSRSANGWSLQKSSYRKLRLAPDDVALWLTEAGFDVMLNAPKGRMQALMARN